MNWRKTNGKTKRKFMVVIVLIAMMLQCLSLTALGSLNSCNNCIPLGAWSFDEGKGTIATDSTGNGNNGIIKGATWVKGKIGTALSFNGKSNVQIPYKSKLNPQKAITVEAWVNPVANTQWVKILSKSAHPNTDYSIFCGGKNNVGFSIKIGNVVRTAYSAKNSVPLGKWTYVVGTYDGNRLRLYINGKQVNSFAVNGKINAHAEALTIGGDIRSAYFKGMIDEVRIYDRALTAAEIQRNYQASIQAPELAVPANISVTTEKTSITLTWDAVQNATGYELEADGKIIGNGNKTTFTHTGLKEGTEHTYRVRAKNAQTIGAWSKIIKERTSLATVPKKIIAIATGGASSLILNEDGLVWYRGVINDDPSRMDESMKQLRQIKGLKDITAIEAGGGHYLALKADGTVWAGGDYYERMLTDGVLTRKSIESVQVEGLAEVKAIAAGYMHNLVLKRDGTVWSWGYNDYGQLGYSTATEKSIVPIQVKGLENVIAISAGIKHSLALKSDGTVWAWGRNWEGQLGNGTTTHKRNDPAQVKGLEAITAIEAGGVHSLAIKKDGIVWAWGDNYFGELGNGTTEDSAVPVQVNGLKDVTATAAYDGFNVALKRDGTVWAWGNNDYGQLGDGTTIRRTKPVQTKVKDIVAIAAGGCQGLALQGNGVLYAWGSNFCGQLGDGTTEDRHSPVIFDQTLPY